MHRRSMGYVTPKAGHPRQLGADSAHQIESSGDN